MFKNLLNAIDTISIIATLHRVKIEMVKLDLEFENEVSESLIKRFKREIQKGKKVDTNIYELQVIKISKAKSIIGYLLVKKNPLSVVTSKKQKRSKDHKRELVFAGLHQPHLKTNQEHIKNSFSVIAELIKACKVNSIDFSIDGYANIPIVKHQVSYLDYVFRDYVNHLSRTEHYENSYYINNPISPYNPNFVFERVLVYDKCLKHKLNGKYLNWKRLEVTVNINQKLSASLLYEIQESVSHLSLCFFNQFKYDDEPLKKQIELMKMRD